MRGQWVVELPSAVAPSVHVWCGSQQGAWKNLVLVSISCPELPTVY